MQQAMEIILVVWMHIDDWTDKAKKLYVNRKQAKLEELYGECFYLNLHHIYAL